MRNAGNALLQTENVEAMNSFTAMRKIVVAVGMIVLLVLYPANAISKDALVPVNREVICTSIMDGTSETAFTPETVGVPEIVYTPQDRQIFHNYIAYIRSWQSLPIDTLLEKTALFFLDCPYVSHTLEMPGEERMVVNLREFDCTTFVESVIALARTVNSGQSDFDTFLNELQRVRYRDGNLQGYASRLHYTSDWVFNNEQMGILENRSARLHGVAEKKTINFMTTHRDAYRQLKNDDTLLQEIGVIENNINQRGGFYYLPKEKITAEASFIPHMSMVAFTTAIKGLDVSHMGFTIRQGDRLTFIHASSARGKVVIDQKTLNEYCAGQSSCTGIIVAKILPVN